MVYVRLFAAGIALSILSPGVVDGRPSIQADWQPPTAPAPDSGAVAVVELFTSEGCSSCPPADRLLRSLVETARAGDRPIYALSFHVDYWNRLGWKDPYSKSAFSRYQQRYSQSLGVDTYTPQIVVNGQQAMIGSRAGQVRSAIEGALDEPTRATVDLTIKKTEEDLEVAYQFANIPPENTTLRLAVVERGLSQKVTRGENAGRTLHHANVVRTFKTIRARDGGTLSLPVSDEVDRSQASVICYVQTPSMDVIGATRVEVPET